MYTFLILKLYCHVKGMINFNCGMCVCVCDCLSNGPVERSCYHMLSSTVILNTTRVLREPMNDKRQLQEIERHVHYTLTRGTIDDACCGANA